MFHLFAFFFFLFLGQYCHSFQHSQERLTEEFTQLQKNSALRGKKNCIMISYIRHPSTVSSCVTWNKKENTQLKDAYNNDDNTKTMSTHTYWSSNEPYKIIKNNYESHYTQNMLLQ